jgi:hypothetical protein
MRRIAMGRTRIAHTLFCLLILSLSQRGAEAGQILTPLQTRSIAPQGVLVSTDWGPGTNGITNPLSFDRFDPKLGTLEAVYVTMSTTIRNDYILTFVNTPITTTLYVATSKTPDPSILSDPTKRAKLTDGPTVILNGPDGISQIFGPPATTQPVDFLRMTETSGRWSSLLPINDPNYIAPTMTDQSYSRALDAANAGSLLAGFIGTGMVDLPLTATAYSSFFTDSGNGGGVVLTRATATITIQYLYAAVPEPSSAILATLGIGMTMLVGLLRRSIRRRGVA